MTTVAEGLKAQLRNIEVTYGKPVEEWLAVIADSGLTKHADVVLMLKARHGLKHAAAHRLSLVSRANPAGPLGTAETAGTVIDALYSGRRATLLPIHRRLIDEINRLGQDVELAPKKGYLSLRRRKQFGMIQPGATWVNVGLILPVVTPGGRLESAGHFNALFTHRVRVRTEADVDEELRRWLQAAYSISG